MYKIYNSRYCNFLGIEIKETATISTLSALIFTWCGPCNGLYCFMHPLFTYSFSKVISILNIYLILKLCQSQQLSSALSSACDFKSHFCKQCGPRSDRSTLSRVHTVCLYANIDLKSLQEYSADDINRRHF